MSSLTSIEPTEPGARDAIDLAAYWRILLRRRWIALPCLAVVVLGTLFYSIRQVRIYEAVCTVIIDLTAPKVLDHQQVQDVVDSGSGAYWYSKEYYETQYKVITSRAVAARAADRLRLRDDPVFLGLSQIQDPEQRSQAMAAADPVASLQARLKVEPVKESRLVRIRAEDPDPVRAADLANAVAEAYIAESLAVRSATTESASEWLEKQLADLQAKLEESSKKLFEFKKANDIVSTSFEDRQSMVSQRMVTINEALTKARIEKAQAKAKAEAVEDLKRALDEGREFLDGNEAITSNRLIQELKVGFLAIKNECAEIKQRYLERHPKVVSCDEKLNTARANLRREIEAIVAASRSTHEAAARAEQNVSRLYEEAKAESFVFNQHEGTYTELKRAVDNNQRLYDLVLKRLKDAGLSGMLQMSNVRILDRAQPPKLPTRPNVSRNLIVAAILGFILGVALAFGVETFDTSIASQEQVERRLGLPFLGIVPRVEKGEADLAGVRDPRGSLAECLRTLRTNLLFMSPDRPLRTLLVTSSGPMEGKTTLSISLATTLAETGHRVLLIEADLRRPRLHRAFGISGGAGLTSLVVGECDLATAVKATEVPGVSLLPCGAIPPNPTELLHAEAFNQLLKELSARYDRIIVDAPPAGALADAAVISTRVDGTILVLRANKTSREAANRATKALRDVKARVLGVVLNDVDLAKGRASEFHYYELNYERERKGRAAS